MLDFYARNPHVEFEQANLWLVEVMEALFEKKAQSESVAAMQAQLSLFAQSLGSQMAGVKGALGSLEDAVVRSHADGKAQLAAQLAATKREYLEDIRPVLENQALTLADKCASLADKNAAFFGERMALVLHDQTPRLFQDPLRDMFSSLKCELDLLAAKKDKSVDEFAARFELKYANMLKSLEPVYASIASLQGQNDRIAQNLADFTAKFRSSNAKGRCSESLLSSVLHTMFPSGYVEDTSAVKASGDCVLARPNIPHRIMFENKHYERNVDREEVEKFVRDVDHLRMHAVLVSQKSGIAMKHNFQIELHKGCVLVFVHRGDYCADKLQIAVDIIDTLALRLAAIDAAQSAANNNNGVAGTSSSSSCNAIAVPQELMDAINTDYAALVRRRENMLLLVRDFQKSIVHCIDEIQLPSLDALLRQHYSVYGAAATATATTTTAATTATIGGAAKRKASSKAAATNLVCDHCVDFVAQNKAALSAHRRACLKPNTV